MKKCISIILFLICSYKGFNQAPTSVQTRFPALWVQFRDTASARPSDTACVFYFNGNFWVKRQAGTFWENLLDGSGTVTSISQGYGIITTPNPITNSGSINADTLVLSTRAWRQKGDDSLAALITAAAVSVVKDSSAGPFITPAVNLGNRGYFTNGVSRFNAALGLGSSPIATSITKANGWDDISYNTSDQSTNYERVRQYWIGNTYRLWTERGAGASLTRPISIGNSQNTITIDTVRTTITNIVLTSGISNTGTFTNTGTGQFSESVNIGSTSGSFPKRLNVIASGSGDGIRIDNGSGFRLDLLAGQTTNNITSVDGQPVVLSAGGTRIASGGLFVDSYAAGGSTDSIVTTLNTRLGKIAASTILKTADTAAMLTKYVNTYSNQLTINGNKNFVNNVSTNSSFNVNKNSSASSQSYYALNNQSGMSRYIFGNVNAETGSGNTGFDFRAFRYGDDGTQLGAFLSNTRSSGATRLDSLVGIKISTPNYDLQVNSFSTSSVIQLTNSTTGTNATHGSRLLQSGLDFIINNREAGAVSFETSNTNRYTIDASGNNIWTGAATFGGTLAANLSSATQSNVVYYNTSTKELTYGASGAVSSDSLSVNYAYKLPTTSSTPSAFINNRIGYNSNSGTYIYPKSGAFGDLTLFNSSGQQRILIGSSIQLNGSVFTAGSILPNSDNGYDLGSSSSSLRFRKGVYSDSLIGGSGKFTDLSGSGSRTVLADANGQLSAPVSDSSIKLNVHPLIGYLDKVMKLNPISFYFDSAHINYGDTKQYGYVAQQVRRVFPEIVFTNPKTGLKGINYGTGQWEAILGAAIQELKKEKDAQINELKEEINSLKQQLTQLLQK